MTRSIPLLAIFSLVLAAAPRLSGQAVVDPHVRSVEPEILDALSHGTSVSPTLHRLVDALEASDVVVYIEFDRSPSPLLAGRLSFLASVSGRRYLRVSIDRRLIGSRRLAIIGHELRHAVEVAESAGVRSEPALAGLYQRIGFPSSCSTRECYESVSAMLAGRMVEKEALVPHRTTSQ